MLCPKTWHKLIRFGEKIIMRNNLSIWFVSWFTWVELRNTRKGERARRALGFIQRISGIAFKMKRYPTRKKNVEHNWWPHISMAKGDANKIERRSNVSIFDAVLNLDKDTRNRNEIRCVCDLWCHRDIMDECSEPSKWEAQKCDEIEAKIYRININKFNCYQ